MDRENVNYRSDAEKFRAEQCAMDNLSSSLFV